MAFKSLIPASTISQKIRELLQKAQAENICLEFCRVPGHSDIEDNEKSDTSSKYLGESVRRIMPTRVLPHIDMEKSVLAAVKPNWLER